MIKLLNSEQLKTADEFSISQQRIRSIDLMERAAEAFVRCLRNIEHLPSSPSWYVFCGYGNNGGDGLAIARLLKADHEDVNVFYLADRTEYSEDFMINLDRLKRQKGLNPKPIESVRDFPSISQDAVIIDALFGSGLNKPLRGLAQKLVNYLNEHDASRVAVDIPSGLFADRLTTGTTFHASCTISFHSPKLAFFFPENAEAVGYFRIVDIGLSEEVIDSMTTANFLLAEDDMRGLLRRRKKFDHKGKYGHALIHAGSVGKMGAAILCARACARTGAGLTTAHIPLNQSYALNVATPEVMTREYGKGAIGFKNMKEMTAFAAGPGMGTGSAAKSAMLNLLREVHAPVVLDADAITLLATEKKWTKLLPPRTILTPHLKEFERVAGITTNWLERHQRQSELSVKHSIYIVLKGAYTCITTPEGNSFFNPTGNPGMAKGGSGDVLTGMIVSLLAQYYPPQDACLLGVYLHGLAADLAVDYKSQQSLLASDIIDNIGTAFRKIEYGKEETTDELQDDSIPRGHLRDHDFLQLN
jgi:NAD(P)H-hydrate epimerase